MKSASLIKYSAYATFACAAICILWGLVDEFFAPVAIGIGGLISGAVLLGLSDIITLLTKIAGANSAPLTASEEFAFSDKTQERSTETEAPAPAQSMDELKARMASLKAELDRAKA